MADVQNKWRAPLAVNSLYFEIWICFKKANEYDAIKNISEILENILHKFNWIKNDLLDISIADYEIST